MEQPLPVASLITCCSVIVILILYLNIQHPTIDNVSKKVKFLHAFNKKENYRIT